MSKLTCTPTSNGRKTAQPTTQTTILIVDDQPMSRIALNGILRQSGYDTLQAQDGAEAWEMLARHNVSLVVTDNAMPRLNGFGLCDRMKSDHRYRLTPVVMVTGADDIASRIAAFEHGADDILPKPVINEELVARVRNLIRFAGLVREQMKMELSRAELARELAVSKMRNEQEEARNRLYRDVLFAATGGTLQLMDPAIMEPLLSDWTHVSSLRLTDTSQIREARHVTESVAREAGMREEAVGDVVLCVSEAVTNALKFGTQADFRCGLKDNKMQIYVRDDGPGLDRATLPQVTLSKGYSSHASMGMGFPLMLETMELVGLCTGPSGTAVLLTKGCVLDEDQRIDQFLDRFSVAF